MAFGTRKQGPLQFRDCSSVEFVGAYPTYEDAVRRCAPIRRAIGILYRAMREECKLTRPELADQSNVPARENSGELKEGRATFCLGDMMRLCAVSEVSA